MNATPCVLEQHVPRHVVLSPTQAKASLKWWANRLCLTHWAIDLKLVRRYHAEDWAGLCDFDLARNIATISLVDPNDFDANGSGYDMEQVIVHELLHLHFAAWSEWSAEDAGNKMTKLAVAVCEEQPIDRLAAVLVEMRRSNPDDEVSWYKPMEID